MATALPSPRKLARERFNVNYLLSVDSDPKTAKSNALGEYLTAILYMTPGTVPGLGNVCASASDGCLSACLHRAGNPIYQRNKERARLNRRKLFMHDRELFRQTLYAELERFCALAESKRVKPCVRLNGTSDNVYEKLFPELFTDWHNVQWYDYTKHVKRCLPNWELPRNYHLTFSRSESNGADVGRIIRSGSRVNVACVFSYWRTAQPPRRLWTRAVINADKHDLRFTDPERVICALSAKGPARKDDSGFVINVG